MSKFFLIVLVYLAEKRGLSYLQKSDTLKKHIQVRVEKLFIDGIIVTYKECKEFEDISDHLDYGLVILIDAFNLFKEVQALSKKNTEHILGVKVPVLYLPTLKNFMLIVELFMLFYLIFEE